MITIALISFEAIRLAIGLIFLISFLGKLRDMRGFLLGVVDYKVLPSVFATSYGILLIPLEAFVAISFLFNWLLNFGSFVSLFLLISFMIAVGWNVQRKRTILCNCLGSSSKEQVSIHSLLRIFLLIIGNLLITIGLLVFKEYQFDISLNKIYPSEWYLKEMLEVVMGIFVLAIGMLILEVPQIFRIISPKHK